MKYGNSAQNPFCGNTFEYLRIMFRKEKLIEYCMLGRQVHPPIKLPPIQPVAVTRAKVENTFTLLELHDRSPR